MSVSVKVGWLATLALACFLGETSPAHAAGKCEALLGLKVPAKSIALPTRGARIETTAIHAAEADLPETCRINGEILAADPASPSLKFQVNLPAQWNGKAVQYGGGGLNGLLVDAVRSRQVSLPGGSAAPNPLARGYATFGSDGGHQAKNPLDSSFGRNAEARANYTGEAVKRLRDAVLAVFKEYYGRTPKRLYYAGGSKGGHEGLVAAQRYGKDFDGVISFYPAKDSVGLILGWGALTEAAYGSGGTALSADKQAFVQKSVLAACDGLDGLEDGVIANTAACGAAIGPASLTCRTLGESAQVCLSDAEAATLSRALRRTDYPYPLANGVAGIGPFPVMTGASLAGTWLSPAGRSATAFDGLGNGIVRDFWTHDPNANIGTIDLATLRGRIEAHSRQSDATSTDLDAFAAHGGKLLLVQGTLDMLVPPSATTDYFVRVAGRYGGRTSEIVRYFVQPGYGHGDGPFVLSWDTLDVLDRWVESGDFPAGPIATDANPATRGRQMPLCEYPLFPRYTGGDASKAASFRCSGD